MSDDKKRTNLQNLSLGISVFNSTTDAYNRLKGWYTEKYLYTATLKEDAFVFPEMMAYIDDQTDTRKFRFVSTRSGISKFYNSDADVDFLIDGHVVKAGLYKPPGSEGGMDVSAIMNIKQSVHFTCRSADGLQALENLLADFTKKKATGEKSTFIGSPTTYGDWDYSPIPKKRIDSVFLPPGVKEDLLADIERFMESEDKFLNVGLPWHRGYCFYGEPGNGKSSIALALANHFALDLHNMPLSSIKDDNTLTNVVSNIRNKSILLLEDIDIFSKTMKREQEKEAPTLAGLLNTLDGVATPHGLITIMTTNHMESLDPALIRPGRMDYKIELKAPVAYQIEQMFEKLFEEKLGIEPAVFGSMAEVADVFKRHLEDPEAVRVALKAG